MPVNGDPHKMFSRLITQCWNALEETAVIMLCGVVNAAAGQGKGVRRTTASQGGCQNDMSGL